MSAFPGPLLTALVAVLAVTGPAGGQDDYDNTPSEAAATGFMSGFVDQRMLSLPAQGVGLVTGTVAVTMSNTAGLSERISYQFRLDFTTGQSSMIPEANPPALEERWRAAADNSVRAVFALMSPPSSPTADFVMSLHREDQEVRIDCRPRLRSTPYDMSLWFTPEGTLLRKRTHVVGYGDKVETSEATYKYRDIGQRTVTTQETVTVGSLSQVSKYEYTSKNGVLVLQRIHTDSVLAWHPEEKRWQRLPVVLTLDIASELAAAGG